MRRYVGTYENQLLHCSNINYVIIHCSNIHRKTCLLYILFTTLSKKKTHGYKKVSKHNKNKLNIVTNKDGFDVLQLKTMLNLNPMSQSTMKSTIIKETALPFKRKRSEIYNKVNT